MPELSPVRWLIVVPRDQRELFVRLRQSLKADAPFQVTLERRELERRQGGGGASGPERRRADRRQPRPVGQVYVGAAVGEPAPALPPAAAALRGAPTLVTTACPGCLETLSFELPRFPRPPARLDADIVHVDGVGAPQHYAEIQAFTVSGRPLLIGRVQAFRCRAAGVSPGG